MKWNRKLRTAAALSAAGLALTGLAGCAGGNSGTSASASASAHVPTVALVLGGLNDNFWITMKCGAEAAAKAAGASLTTQGPTDGSATLQKPIIDAIVASKPDVLVVSAADSTAMQGSIKAAADAGIKVVFVNNATVDASFATSQVLSDDVAGGKAGFDAIKQLNPNGGKVLVIGTQPGVQNTDNRVKGFEAAVKADPSFNYLGIQYNHESISTAAQLVASALQKDPDIIGIFAVNQGAAEGSATGLKQVGMEAQVTLVGYDAGPSQIQELRDNTVQALIAQQPGVMGQRGVEIGLAALAGESVEPLVTTPLTIITRANVDTVGADAAYKAVC